MPIAARVPLFQFGARGGECSHYQLMMRSKWFWGRGGGGGAQEEAGSC